MALRVFLTLFISLPCFAAEYTPGYGIQQSNEVPIVQQNAAPVSQTPASEPTKEQINGVPQSASSIQGLPQGTYDDYSEYCERNGWKFDPKVKIGCIKN